MRLSLQQREHIVLLILQGFRTYLVVTGKIKYLKGSGVIAESPIWASCHPKHIVQSIWNLAEIYYLFGTICCKREKVSTSKEQKLQSKNWILINIYMGISCSKLFSTSTFFDLEGCTSIISPQYFQILALLVNMKYPYTLSF